MSIQEGTIGAPIVATVKTANPDGSFSVRNIADATVKKFIWRKPDGTQVEKPVEFLNDGSDGKLIYTTLDEDDTTPYGLWRLQSYTEQPTFKGRSKVATYYVLNNI